MNFDVRILVLEDNPLDAELMEDILRASGIKFSSKRVDNEEEFCNSLNEFSPDLILSDYDLPVFTGLEALKLRQKICPDVPFILVTGAVGEERAIEILTGGATDYVMKNRLSRLLPAVERALKEAEEQKRRKKAEAERDLLLKQMELKVQERTAELQAEIAARRQAEKALRYERTYLEQVLQQMPIAVVLAQAPGGNLVFGNRACELLFKHPVNYSHNYEEYRKWKLFDSEGVPVPPEQFPLLLSIEKGEFIADKEMMIERGDGTRAMVNVNASPIIDADGNVIAGVGTMFDITERKRVKDALRKANDELEEKVRQRTDQLADINKSLLEEIEDRKRTENELRSAQKNLRAMASEIIIAEEKSRQQFAAELHDSVIQTLGAVKLRFQLIREHIAAEGAADYSELFGLVSQSIKEARQIMAELSPPLLDQLGFVPAIEWLTEQIASSSGLDIEFRGKSFSDTLAHEVQVLLFQATRELLMNVVKHSKSKEALVSISQVGSFVRVTVKDNGTGFHGRVSFREDNSGFGLFSIRERLKHLGGHLVIESKPASGTRVTMVSPRMIE
jgi:signal transduction histidine kinase